uniref:K(+)/H(+) antiporter 13 n=2 Tax=Cajanus cajan TaxID=3821 RepID=A0A151UA60_CAJCA|nr:K(+)/H(+) antiporter 13 [Cajanus cajan]
MTRVFPAPRLLQAPNGWHQHVNPSRHLVQQNIVNITVNNLTIPFPILCHSTQDAHSSGIFSGDSPFSHSFSLLMFNLIFITSITRIVRILLKPLRQPLIISQIIGGVIVGPSFLGRCRWFQHHMSNASSTFLVNNLGVMGFMFFLFTYGVKMDPGLLRKSGKLHVSTALIGITIPTFTVFAVSLCLRKNMDKELAKIPSLGVISGYLGVTAFPVLYHILKEFNLLNSDVGRVSLATALIGDTFGLIFIMAFEAASQGEVKIMNTVWYVISLAVVVSFLVFCVRPAMAWINDNTPEGHPVHESFVLAIILGSFVMGFITDMFGIAIANGSLFLGLTIPNGPRVGATIVEKTTTITNELLLPFSFLLVGSQTDFYAMSASDWTRLSPLFVMVITGYFTKFFSVWITLYFWRVPFRDGLTLSLIMSLRGQIELLLFVHWMDKSILNVPGFTLLVLMTIIVTAIFTPLISILYDPSKPYMVNQRRDIQHNPPDEELRIVLCILDTENINGLIHLLDISNPTSSNPFSIYVVRLTELIGRANPLFLDNEKQQVPPMYQWTNTINILKTHQQLKGTFMKLHFFTSVAPKQSMFRDICELALEQETSLIILPFDSVDVRNHAVKTVNSQVLNNAPCSVAIFVDKGLFQMSNTGSSFRRTRHRFGLLFLGGGDAREALVFADRMVANEDVFLTVIRFLSHNFIGYNELEKKLDDGTVTWFWVKNETNQRVAYREVVVRNGEETIAAIQAMNDGAFDLLIVGRKQGINPVILTGLSEWSESDELGIIGDYVSSEDFFGSASVLVVQQQILRG